MDPDKAMRSKLAQKGSEPLASRVAMRELVVCERACYNRPHGLLIAAPNQRAATAPTSQSFSAHLGKESGADGCVITLDRSREAG
jgi:hypothetical protein